MKRRMMILAVALLSLMVVLAACGGDDDNGDGDNGSDTSSSAADTELSSGNGPADFAIVGDPAIAQTVTGASAASDVTNDAVSLLFYESLSELIISIDNIPYDQTPGAYDIQTVMDLDRVSAEVVNASANYTTYSSTGGTLEITEWNDNTMSGTFEFFAEKEVEEGEAPITVTVTGAFTGIPAPQPVE